MTPEAARSHAMHTIPLDEIKARTRAAIQSECQKKWHDSQDQCAINTKGTT